MIRKRLRVPVEDLRLGALKLTGEAARYVARVHRVVVGDRLVVFDPDAVVEADAEVVRVGRDEVELRAEAPRPAARPRRLVTLIQGIGKGDKMDAVVRDATELGATRIVPALAERSVARPTGAPRADRWRRIAVEAARQCGRGDAPTIEPTMSFGEAFRRFAPAVALGGAGLCLDPWSGAPIGRAFRRLAVDAEATFAVGPEGGFAEGELAEAVQAGFERVTLGALVLRTETVCAAVLGALLALEHEA
jgi:16S rRNA (uracil1498-N3)-methyltransferase